MNLLIDLGNSRLKWATAQTLIDLVPGETISNPKLTIDKLVELWQSINQPEQIALACVGNQHYSHIVRAAVKTLWPDQEINALQAQASALGVVNAYVEPEKLGVDRWLSMVAAYQKLQKTFCLVSLGTAITLDIVNHDGQHLGGLIAPGLRLMQDALAQNTVNLNLELGVYPKGLATITEAAIVNGTLAAACGLIETTLNNYANPMPVVLSGGDAKTIAEALPRPTEIAPNLVLEGMILTLNG